MSMNPRHSTARGFYYKPFLNDTAPQEQRTVAADIRQQRGPLTPFFSVMLFHFSSLFFALEEISPAFAALMQSTPGVGLCNFFIPNFLPGSQESEDARFPIGNAAASQSSSSTSFASSTSSTS